MASTHHAAAQHPRYPLVTPANTRDEFRLPSLKDLNFQYQPRGPSSHESPQHASAGPIENSLNGQDNAPRHVQSWNRPNVQPQSPPTMPMHHQHQHQHQQQHPHQQHTPPLSAGHEPPPSKVEYTSKQDNGGFLTPGMPLSAQSTPVPGSLNIGPGTRSDEGAHGPSQAKRRRSSANIGTPRDVRTPHTGYPPPQYASYPPSQSQSLPPPGSYHQAPPGTHQSHPAPASQEPIHHHAAPVPHPGYHTYQPPPQQYMPPRAHPQHPSHHQPQPTHGNPYPSPGPPPAPPPQVAWEQPHHQPQPPPPPPPPPTQHHPHPHHLPPPPPQHTQHPQHPHHVPAHQQPPQSFPPQHSQQMHVQPQHQQHQSHQPPPPPPSHLSQHPQMHSQPQHPQAQHPQLQHPQSQHSQPQHSQPHHSQPQHSQIPPPQPSQLSHPQPPQPSQPQHQHLPHPQHQPQHQPQLQQQQPQQMPFARTTAIVPTNIDTRVSYAVSESDQRLPSARDSTMSEIVKHCTALYAFASHYAQLQASLPEAQPSASELAEMSQRAIQVVRLLEEYRRLNFPEAERTKFESVAAAITSPDDHRPPKRPWEDMSQDGNAGGPETASYSEEQQQQPQQQYPTSVDKAQTTAEQDMEIIRTKRATSAAGGTGTAGQPKSKYRKRSRATPPGKCHSCNIRETPEWRRGPDGARTLCNACGLHYAKLMRKRDKAGGNGDAPRIDMDTLRASARAADLADKSHSRSKASRSQQSIEPTSPMEPGKPLPQQHHQGSFQLVQMMPQDLAPPPPHPEPIRVPPPQQQQHSHQSMPQSASSLSAAPPPPWATNVPSSSAGGARGYAPDQLQHQSFMRTSQHPTATHTSPR